MKDSISVIIPAYNEEHSLKEAVRIARGVVSHEVSDYEIIIVNDGSTDTTGTIAQRLAGKQPRVHVIHHKYNEGFGAAFKDGFAVASKKYVTGFPADNDLHRGTFEDIVTARKNDCIAITYAPDMSQRKIIRQIISIAYTKIMNLVFGLDLKYYNGYFICPSKVMQSLTLTSEGFTLFAEIKIKLIKKGVRYIEIPYVCGSRRFGASKSLTLKSIIQTIATIPILIWDVYVKALRAQSADKGE